MTVLTDFLATHQLLTMQAGPWPPWLQVSGHRPARRDVVLSPPGPHGVHLKGHPVEGCRERHRGARVPPGQPDPYPGQALMERITGAVAIRCGGTFALGGINPCSCVQPLCLSEGLQFKG